MHGRHREVTRIMKETGYRSDKRRIAVWMTQEEADAVLNILLQAPPSPEVPDDVAERLLVRVADVQRAFCREERKAQGRMNATVVSRRLLRRPSLKRAR
jgi:hypothetical protein